jgi:hypothetical protein
LANGVEVVNVTNPAAAKTMSPRMRTSSAQAARSEEFGTAPRHFHY